VITIPVFALNTVLFPGGVLPLRIFEPRYLDMVSDCLKNDKDFGVCLIFKGLDVGKPAEVFEIGTLANITNWDREASGLLDITAIGSKRFRVINTWTEENKLIQANVEYLEQKKEQDLPAEFQSFSDRLRKIVEKFNLPYANEHEKFTDSYWVSYRLAELLPIAIRQRQSLLEMDDPIDRLKELQAVLDKIKI
jgi:Lon protease-like protein